MLDVGDIVKISSNYWFGPVAGRTGVVSVPCSLTSMYCGKHYRIDDHGVYLFWVELHNATGLLPNDIEAVEVPQDSLRSEDGGINGPGDNIAS